MEMARDTAASPPLEAHSSLPPLLEVQDVVKRYGSVTALHSVHFDLVPGEIHALLGENGAGKSTLMHLLAGLTRPDSGRVLIEGKEREIASPKEARRLGIAMVHQHFTLVPAFTVAENLALDSPERRSSLLYRPTQAAVAALERAASLGWPLEANRRVSDLPVGLQQRVEIVKALATEARLLIFDEPTAVLTGSQVEELFIVLRRLRDEGRSIVLIAHKLAEILAVADRVTVLRRGRNIATTSVAATDAHQLAIWMVGESDIKAEVSQEVSHRERAALREGPDTIRNPTSQDQKRLSAEGLSILGERGEIALEDVEFRVEAGRIFGIGGVDGNGQTELAEALTGLRSIRKGSLHWNDGAFLPGRSPRIGYIPQDRRRSGLAVTLSVEENLLFDAVRDPAYRTGPFLRRKALKRLAAELIQRFDIRVPSASSPASNLSGGNQQKIVAARALYTEPELIVAVNPTRGLDIGATRFVHGQLLAARARGAVVVLISTDLDELALLADQGGILSGGRLQTAEFSRQSSAQIGLLLGGIALQIRDKLT